MTASDAVPSVVRASHSVLLAVSNAGPVGANAPSICRETGLHKRSVYRHLKALQELGMIEASREDSRRYHLGAAAVGLAVQASDQRAFLRRARVYADELTEQTGEPVHVTVYEHGTSVTVASPSMESLSSVDAFPITLGSRRPAHASASGKLFLAFNAAALTAYLTRPLQAFTEYTISDPHVLRTELVRIRERGWASDTQENILGVSCVAVPVWGRLKRVVGSLAVTTGQPLMPAPQRQTLLEQLLPAATEFSKAIGGEPS
ncbi:IclR family transcriptional regulator [Streptomyces sp. SID3343]|uniref:IclR family transcriptional regulator n=1 Tax=Streptomyces sp. SID3343 TaxID=2690260 RepID=UPI00136B1A76|nr:IclR family transcriptional regulator [Streptomyces sp. SID3343]MYW05261.1 IclR family transcriptional regulator [Streptomyces sp. SID3343]